MKYYYTTAANQPAGPVTLDELRQLLGKGEIHLATHVVPVGGTTWQPLSSLFGTTAPTVVLGSPPAGASPSATVSSPTSSHRPATTASNGNAFTKLPTVLASLIGKLLELVRGLLNPRLLQSSFGFGATFGQLLVLVGIGLTLIVSIKNAIQLDSFRMFLLGLAAVLLIAILQFVAMRFLESCASIVKKSPTRVASLAVLDCFALLLLVIAVVSLVSGIVMSVQFRSIDLLIPMIVYSLILFAAAGVALHPQLAVVEQAEATAGEEAIGIVSFFAKANLVLMPLIFFLLAAAGVITLLFDLFGKQLESVQALVPFSIPLPALGGGASLLAAACLLPFMSYIAFLFYYLLLDVLRAILVVPSKLDQLRH